MILFDDNHPPRCAKFASAQSVEIHAASDLLTNLIPSVPTNSFFLRHVGVGRFAPQIDGFYQIL